MLQKKTSIEAAIMPFKLQQLIAVIMEKKQLGVEDAFCLEKYKDFSKHSAEETLLTFRKYRVFDFLREGFDMLHTQGESYITDEIDLYIKARTK